MRTITTEVFTFEELSDESKEKARDWFQAGNDFDFEWDCIKEDAATIGLILSAWDYGRYAKGSFISEAKDTAEKIMKEHGQDCETFKTASDYLEEVKALEDTEDNEDALESADTEFLKSMLEDYRIMADKQHDYINSDEAVDENIIINEYEFTKEGKII